MLLQNLLILFRFVCSECLLFPRNLRHLVAAHRRDCNSLADFRTYISEHRALTSVIESAAIRQNNNVPGWTSHYVDNAAISNSNLYVLPEASRFSVQESHDNSRIGPDVLFDQDPEISPPLEVVPLIVSGSSANRVDFVFFSDGCESRPLEV